MGPAAARPYARTIFTLQAALTLVVVGYTLDLQRKWLGLALYTEQFLVVVVGLAIALAFLTVPAHPRWRGRVPWWDVLAVVKQGDYLAAEQIAQVERFLNAPAEWSAAHGGVSSFPSS